MPGMNGKVSFENVQKPETLIAPKEAIIKESNQSVAFVVKKDGSNEKRTIKTGDSDSTMIEIIEGLSEGEKILLKKPE